MVTSAGQVLVNAPIDAIDRDLSQVPPVPVKPPTADRAQWVREYGQPYPGATTAPGIYAHACLHIRCAFDGLRQVKNGDFITVYTTTGTLTYQAIQEDTFSKNGTGSVNSLSRDAPNELRLFTCAYAPDGSSPDNLVVTSLLVAAHAG